MNKLSLSIFMALAIMSVQFTCSAKSLNEYLAGGAVAEGIAEFSQKISQPDFTDEDVFSLGALQFFAGLENLAQSLYKYGLDSQSGRNLNLPFLRFPVPLNPNPQTVTPSAVAELLAQFRSDMRKANLTLEKIKDQEFNVPLDIAKVRLDINDNGRYENNEFFYQIYVVYNRPARNLFQADKPFIIQFDTGDAYWLKGYTHLLMAITDTLLAYDGTKVFEHTAHVFFSKVETEIAKLLQQQKIDQDFSHLTVWADLIAGIHVMNMPVIEPERLKRAHEHLLSTIACSRKSWMLIESEQDNANEWIPNPRQTSVTGTRISAEMIQAWKIFLREFEAILNGDKLIPHWRIKDGRGVNLKKVFFEPRSFDPVLWLQGTSAIPYLEKGEMTTQQTWRQIMRVFRGNFIGFAIWVN